MPRLLFPFKNKFVPKSWWQRALVALWISIGAHGALIALVQIVRPANSAVGGSLEMRIESVDVAAYSDADLPVETTLLYNLEDVPLPYLTEMAESLPVSQPIALPEAGEPPVRVSGSTSNSAVDLNYYTTREVDVPPHVLVNIEPNYPNEADSNGISGRVRLQLKIEADGSVSEVEVITAVPPGLFERVTLDAFRQARFSPAQKQGRAVRSMVLIEVRFDHDGKK